MEYLSMKTDSSGLISSDFNELKIAAVNLVDHATKLGGVGFFTSFFQWFACAAAIYLLILDRTNWRTNMLTSLLVPYIFLSCPSLLFNLFRGEVGKWIAFVAVVLMLFFPTHFPGVKDSSWGSRMSSYKDWLEMPVSLILLLVVAPSLFAHSIKGSLVGTIICLVIGCYLLQEHIRASGGFRAAFTKSNGLSNSIGIFLLFVYPVWALVFHFI